MHVIYDGRLMFEHCSGLGRFTGELLFALLDSNTDAVVQYTVIIHDNEHAWSGNPYYYKLRLYESKGACRVVFASHRPISLRHHFLFSRFIDGLGGDVYFYAHFDLPLGVLTPSIAVVHDLTPLKVRGYVQRHPFLKKIYFRLMLSITARKADFLFAVSKTTRKDFLAEVGQTFSDKVGVCLEGAFISSDKVEPEGLLTIPLPKNFLFYVGTRLPNKNLKRTIDLFLLLKEKGLYTGSLVLAGPTRNYAFDLDAYCASRPDILILGQIDNQMLDILYKRMDALIFLSQYEGFGLPLVEAGIVEKKMVVSDGGSVPEVAPPWAYVLPNHLDLKSVVFQVGEYLRKPMDVDKDYKDKYTWHGTALRVRDKFFELRQKRR